jgi:hypothetical protein
MTRRPLAAIVLVLLAGAATIPVAAQQAVIIVRHAERADRGTPQAAMQTAAPPSDRAEAHPAPPRPDPPLSDAGRARAGRLAEMLAPTGVKALYATEFVRTQQTVAPLAAALGLRVEIVAAADVPGLVTAVKAAYPSHVVVIAGHSNTVPAVLAAFGWTEPVAIPDDAFDDLFIVVPRETNGPALIRLKY